MKIKMKNIYDLIDEPIIICDNDGHEFTIQESVNMEVVSIQICGDSIMVIVDKFSIVD